MTRRWVGGLLAAGLALAGCGGDALITDDGLWETTSGTLQILEFDEGHIHASFSLAVEDSFDPTRTAEVTGEFAHAR